MRRSTVLSLPLQLVFPKVFDQAGHRHFDIVFNQYKLKLFNEQINVCIEIV
jgi:hypothetical protein